MQPVASMADVPDRFEQNPVDEVDANHGGIIKALRSAPEKPSRDPVLGDHDVFGVRGLKTGGK